MATKPCGRENPAGSTAKTPVDAEDMWTNGRRQTNCYFLRGIPKGKSEQRGGGEQQERRAAVERTADAGKTRERCKRARSSSSSGKRGSRGNPNSSSSSSWRILWEMMYAGSKLSVTSTSAAKLKALTRGRIKTSFGGKSRHRQQISNIISSIGSNSGNSKSGGSDGFPPTLVLGSRRSLGAGARGLFSKARGTSLMALLAVVSAQQGGRAGAAGVTVPLTPVGFQYTANVTVSSGNFSATAPLVVDTTTNIIAFSVCSDDAAGSNDEGGEEGDEEEDEDEDEDEDDEDGDGGDDGTCIPLEKIGNGTKGLCNSWTVDGGTVTLHPKDPSEGQSLAYLEDQDISLSADVSAVGDVVATFNISTAGDSGTLDGWDVAAGVLGLAQYPRRVCNLDEAEEENMDSSAFFSMIRGAASVFALDLGNDTYDSTLEMGGYSGHSLQDMGSIHWGESQMAELPSSFGFSAFDLRVCGRSMMSNVTSFWPAILSTGSACLGLPEEFFDSLMAWLPVKGTCPADPELEGAMCYLSAEAAAEELPSLSFRLSQHGSEIFIPLSSLLLDADDEGSQEEAEEAADLDEMSIEGSSNSNISSSGDRRLCVTRQASIRESGSVFEFPSRQAVVSLGTLPLRSLYAVVDAESGRVGLAQKVDDAPLREAGNNASCQAAAVCVGMESFKESENACDGPSCSSYYLTTLNEESMACESTGIMTILAWVFGIFFGVTEMTGHFLRAYYGSTGVGLRGHQHHQGWEFHTGRLIEACLAKVTRTAGRTPHEREN